jgi:hypothetical protein
MTRHEAEYFIKALYGFPNEASEAALSVAVAAEVLGELGLDALTDDAVIALARRQRAMDDGTAREPSPR